MDGAASGILFLALGGRSGNGDHFEKPVLHWKDRMGSGLGAGNESNRHVLLGATCGQSIKTKATPRQRGC